MTVFIFLVILGVFLLWVLLAFAFRPFGKVVNRLRDDVVDAVTEQSDDKE